MSGRPTKQLQIPLDSQEPLAVRLRPRTLDEFVGQDQILAPGRLLRRAIHADRLSSLLFFGPPGTGKTTLAQIIANRTSALFLSINAVLAGIKDIRQSIESARAHFEETGRRTILFVDEVHRFNKAQQDALLPHVEKGTIVLIGATTENPYFEVNKALVSRSRVFELKSLESSELSKVLDLALLDKERGFPDRTIEIDKDAKDHLVKTANGDARSLLNALELAVITTEPSQNGTTHIDLSTAEESIQQRAVFYDKDGDAHFDTISAFIKSLRGSDVDAALYWMAKMIYGGEDPRFIFRRMLIFASEDVGMADPKALEMVVSAARAYDYVGLPEGRFHLAQACIYLATAEKSNSGFAFFDALKTVSEEAKDEVPDHLKDASRDKKGLGHGDGYLYPHAFRDHWVAQRYLPKSLMGRYFYEPSEQGYESKIKDRIQKRKEEQMTGITGHEEHTLDDAKDFWRQRSFSEQAELNRKLKERLFSLIDLGKQQMVLNLNAETGLILGEVIRKDPTATVYGIAYKKSELQILQSRYKTTSELDSPVLSHADPVKPDLILDDLPTDSQFHRIVARNALLPFSDKQQILQLLSNRLHPDGFLVLAESIPKKGQRLSTLAFDSGIELAQDLYERWQMAEEAIFEDPNDPKHNFDEKDLAEKLNNAGLEVLHQDLQRLEGKTLLPKVRIEKWFMVEDTSKNSYGNQLHSKLRSEEIELIRSLLINHFGDRLVSWQSTWCLIKARPMKLV